MEENSPNNSDGNENTPGKKYICYNCNYETDISSNYKKHMLTGFHVINVKSTSLYNKKLKEKPKEKLVIQKEPIQNESASFIPHNRFKGEFKIDMERNLTKPRIDWSKRKKYVCNECNYETPISSNYKRHKLSNFHLTNVKNELIHNKLKEKPIPDHSVKKQEKPLVVVEKEQILKKNKSFKQQYRFTQFSMELKKNLRKPRIDWSKRKKYICKECRYETPISSNFKRHKLSNFHFANAKDPLLDEEEEIQIPDCKIDITVSNEDYK